MVVAVGLDVEGEPAERRLAVGALHAGVDEDEIDALPPPRLSLHAETRGYAPSRKKIVDAPAIELGEGNPPLEQGFFHARPRASGQPEARHGLAVEAGPGLGISEGAEATKEGLGRRRVFGKNEDGASLRSAGQREALSAFETARREESASRGPGRDYETLMPIHSGDYTRPMPRDETAILEALGIGRGALLLVDSSPLVYFVEGGFVEGGGVAGKRFEGSDRRRAAMEALFGAVREGALNLALSAIAWTELLGKPLAPGLSLAYRRLLAETPKLSIIPVDVAIAQMAAELLSGGPGLAGSEPQRGRARLSLPDALHLATARVVGADAVLTNDEAWLSLAPRDLHVALFDEFAAAISML